MKRTLVMKKGVVDVARESLCQTFRPFKVGLDERGHAVGGKGQEEDEQQGVEYAVILQRETMS